MIEAYPEYTFEVVHNCPICGGKGEFEIAARSNDGGKKFIIQMYSCTVCGTTYHNPRMTKESLDKYYMSGKYRSERIGKDNVEKKEFTSLKRVEYFRDILKFKVNRYLDVGCGLGLLVRDFEKGYGCEAIGFDIFQHPDAVAPIVTSREEVEGKFELITCLHLMEHLYDPLEMMHWLESKLADDGILYFEIPLRRQLLVPHPILFSFRSLDYLVRQTQLKGIAVNIKNDVAALLVFRDADGVITKRIMDDIDGINFEDN